MAHAGRFFLARKHHPDGGDGAIRMPIPIMQPYAGAILYIPYLSNKEFKRMGGGGKGDRRGWTVLLYPTLKGQSREIFVLRFFFSSYSFSWSYYVEVWSELKSKVKTCMKL